MKTTLMLIIAALVSSTATAAFDQPDVFASAPSGVYVPQGFDTNDNVEIFFEGEFTDACYKVGMTSHTVDVENRSIYITDMAYYFGENFCAAMLVPYQKGQNLGMLDKGEWKVYFRHSRGNFVESGYVPVHQAKTSRPDDHLYAPVDKIYFHRGQGDQAGKVELTGKFYDKCMHMDYVKVNQRPGSNVIEILPVAIMDRGGCEEVPEGIDFNYTVKLNSLREGRFLLHTRANNGRSVNEIVTIRR